MRMNEEVTTTLNARNWSSKILSEISNDLVFKRDIHKVQALCHSYKAYCWGFPQIN